MCLQPNTNSKLKPTKVKPTLIASVCEKNITFVILVCKNKHQGKTYDEAFSCYKTNQPMFSMLDTSSWTDQYRNNTQNLD